METAAPASSPGRGASRTVATSGSINLAPGGEAQLETKSPDAQRAAAAAAGKPRPGGGQQDQVAAISSLAGPTAATGLLRMDDFPGVEAILATSRGNSLAGTPSHSGKLKPGLDGTPISRAALLAETSANSFGSLNFELDNIDSATFADLDFLPPGAMDVSGSAGGFAVPGLPGDDATTVSDASMAASGPAPQDPLHVASAAGGQRKGKEKPKVQRKNSKDKDKTSRADQQQQATEEDESMPEELLRMIADPMITENDGMFYQSNAFTQQPPPPQQQAMAGGYYPAQMMMGAQVYHAPDGYAYYAQPPQQQQQYPPGTIFYVNGQQMVMGMPPGAVTINGGGMPGGQGMVYYAAPNAAAAPMQGQGVASYSFPTNQALARPDDSDNVSTGGSVSSLSAHGGRSHGNSFSSQSKNINRGSYKCGKCGKPKVNHVCTFVENRVVDAIMQTTPGVPLISIELMQPFPGERFVTVSNRTSILTDEDLAAMQLAENWPRSPGGDFSGIEDELVDDDDDDDDDDEDDEDDDGGETRALRNPKLPRYSEGRERPLSATSGITSGAEAELERMELMSEDEVVNPMMAMRSSEDSNWEQLGQATIVRTGLHGTIVSAEGGDASASERQVFHSTSADDDFACSFTCFFCA